MGGALATHGQAYYGQGQGRILLDETSCVGNEKGLQYCPLGQDCVYTHCSISHGSHDCGHHEDVGVECEFESPDVVPYPQPNLTLTTGTPR